MSIKSFFDAAREVAGGKLTQGQVDKLNIVVNELSPKTDNTGKTTSQTGVTLIIGFEGLRTKSYDDGVGVWTIGYGTTRYPDGSKVKPNQSCTVDQAQAYFKHDLIEFEDTVNSSVKVQINQNQFDALVSLAYNIGSKAFRGSTLLKKLNSGDYQSAADQFLVWRKAGGKVLDGLVRRRNTERELFLKK